MRALLFLTLIAVFSVAVLSGCNSDNDAPATDSPAVTADESPSPSASPASASVRSQLEQVSFHSKALNTEMAMSVYLPPSYSPDARYPVLYLFYGYGGTHDAYFTYLKVHEVADRLIQEGRIDPLIIVSPDYGNSFAVNTKGEGRNPGGVSVGPFEDYLIQDLIPYIDSQYSTQATKEGRFVGGISMGGFASLHLGFKHPDLFSRIGAHSAALWTYGPTDPFTGQRDWLYPNETLREQRDPFKLADADKLDGVRIYLDAGEQDGLMEQDESLYELLRTMDADVQWVHGPGGHNASYWSGQLEAYLLFYAGKK